MTYQTRIRLIAFVVFAAFAVCPSFESNSALAQGPGRGSRSDEDRRDRGRRYGGYRGEGDRDGDRGRDGRGGSRDGERRGDERSGGSGSSGNSSNGSSSSGSSDSKSSAGPATPSLKTADFAKSFVKERDKNQNNWLDGDELKGLHGKPAEADLNKDGVITVEELTARLSTEAPSPSSSSTPSGGSGGSTSSNGQQRSEGTDRSKGDADGPKRVYTGSTGSPAAATKDGDKRHSYRFRPATERLPSGLPGWFTSKDSNRDGQVSMNEYSRSWSKSTVADFRRVDLNDDGIVTAKEAAKPSAGG